MIARQAANIIVKTEKLTLFGNEISAQIMAADIWVDSERDQQKAESDAKSDNKPNFFHMIFKNLSSKADVENNLLRKMVAQLNFSHNLGSLASSVVF